MGKPRRREDNCELDSTEGNVQKRCNLRIITEALDDDGAECVADHGRDVEAKSHANEKPTLGLEKGFDSLLPLELSRTGTSLVGAEPLDSLQLLVLREEASRGDIVIHEHVHHRRGEDGYETDKDEQNAPRGDAPIDLPKAIGNGSGKHGGKTVGSVPHGHAKGLFSSAIPLRGNDREERQAGGLEESQQETGRKKTAITVASRHADLSNAPSQHKRRHQNTVRNRDDEPGREGQPDQLGNGGDGAHHGVLGAGEVAVVA